MTNDNDRIGLSGSTPDGQKVRFAASLSAQTGWRRRAAFFVAWLGLALMATGLLVAAVNLLR